MSTDNRPPQKPTPQLQMLRPTLDNLPAIRLPADCTLRTYQPGDHANWARILSESFGGGPEKWDFDKIMRGAPGFRPDRVWFLFWGATPAATASAWFNPEIMPDAGTLHFVAARPALAGKKYGYWVSLAALHQMAREGRRRARLATDDFRLPAIAIYLALGFTPLLVDENQRARWSAVFQALNRPDLAETFAPQLNGPIWQAPRHAPDDYDYLARVQPSRRWLAGRRSGRPGNLDIDAFSDESLYPPSALGEAAVSPTEVDARANQPFTLRFRAGCDLPAGTRVRFYTPGQTPLGTSVQAADPGKPGYIEIQGPPQAVLAPLTPGFLIREGALRPGDEVRLSIGAAHGFTWTPLAGRKELKVIVDVGNGEPVRRLPEPCVVRVRPLALDRLDVFLPATPEPGVPVRATVTTRDACDNRVPFNGPVEVRAGAARATAWLRDGLGYADLPPATAPFRATAELAGPPRVAGASNWACPADGRRLFFGDMHAHDITCPAEGYTADVYRWAIEDKRLDFLSVPVQNHAFIDNEKWLIAKYHAETFLDEGRFVTFPAFEWQHSRYGDKVVHYLGNDMPPLPVDDPRYAIPASLYEALRGTDAFIISHHPGYALDLHVPGADWDALEPDVDRLVEIWSMHGSSEGYDPADRPLVPPRREAGVRAALERGLRIGFVGGSDTHSARPGGSAKEPRPYWGGLCAVWATALTRRALFEAFRARRTYALTGARIVLEFTVNDAPMGAEIPPAPEYRLAAAVRAPGPLAHLQFMRNGQVLHTREPGAESGSFTVTDSAPPNAGPLCYHVRVTLEDGHLAVCSPVWIVRPDANTKGPPA